MCCILLVYCVHKPKCHWVCLPRKSNVNYLFTQILTISACLTVRGNPSRRNPFLQGGASRFFSISSTTISSLTCSRTNRRIQVFTLYSATSCMDTSLFQTHIITVNNTITLTREHHMFTLFSSFSYLFSGHTNKFTSCQTLIIYFSPLTRLCINWCKVLFL